jgi:hypothetical protein
MVDCLLFALPTPLLLFDHLNLPSVFFRQSLHLFLQSALEKLFLSQPETIE